MAARWYSPRRMLLLFCAVNLLNYIERGSVASNGVNGRFADSVCASEQCGGGGQPPRDSAACRDLCGYTGIQGDFALSNAQNGLLSSLFTVGLTAAAPPSAHAIKCLHPFTVMGVGQGVFTAGLLLCGFAPSFVALLLSRTLVGAAEPSFTVVAPAYLVDAAPEGRRVLWLALYYLCMPVGTALGYGYGSLFDTVDWRWSFRVQAMLNAPFVIFFAAAERVGLHHNAGDADPPPAEGRPLITDPGPPPRPPARSIIVVEPLALRDSAAAAERRRSQRRSGAVPGRSAAPSPRGSDAGARASPPRSRHGAGSDAAPAAGGAGGGQSLRDDLRALRTVQFGSMVLGLSCFSACSGAIAYWGPKAGASLYPAVEGNVDLLFGAMTVAAGSVGTIAGGMALDRLGGGFRSGARLCVAASVGGCAFCAGALWCPPRSPSVGGFFALMSAGIGMLFAIVAPTSAAILLSVAPPLRPTAMAVSNLVMHVLGDVPSPYYYGAVQDVLNDWRHTFTIFMSLLLVGAGCFAWGLWAAPRDAAAPPRDGGGDDGCAARAPDVPQRPLP